MARSTEDVRVVVPVDYRFVDIGHHIESCAAREFEAHGIENFELLEIEQGHRIWNYVYIGHRADLTPNGG
ncbi:hypothetical protein N806_29805 [Rhodococcus sp. P27]|nr:hypothetical protein N806_29805 [Rhodococcus sp. P27]